MKIVSIIGSPRGMKGATGALLKIVLQGAGSLGAATEIFAITGRQVKPCKACDICHKQGLCPQKDMFNAIKERIEQADGIVLASPNYIFNVSAQMKAFFDRCCGVLHLQSFEGKYGAAVVTSGGGDEAPIADYMQHFLAVTGVQPVGAVWATMGEIEGYNFPASIREKAFSLGERLVKAWQLKEKVPGHEAVTRAFHERMQSLILWRRKEWPYEYQYWEKHHGLQATDDEQAS